MASRAPARPSLSLRLLNRSTPASPAFDLDLADKQVEDARAAMKIFLTTREAYETSLINGEEVVAGIPA